MTRSADKDVGATSGRLSAKQRRTQEKEAQARSRRLRNLLLAASGIALVALVAFLIFRSATAPEPGRFVPSQGNAHPWSTFPDPPYDDYSTSPPTSGPHMGSVAPWGVNDSPIRNELQTHNLEDGGIGIQYNCPEGCPELVEQLAAIVGRYHESVFMAPYPDMDARISLTAWTRIDQLSEFDEDRIVRFINAYRGLDHHVR